MSPCNISFTPYWRNAAIIEQLKNKSKKMAERGTGILKENWWNTIWSSVLN